MEIVIYRKTKLNFNSFPEIIEFNRNNIEQDFSRFIISGHILLLGFSHAEQVGSFINQLDIIDCNFKQKSIELFRSLELEKKTKQNPRKIKIQYSGVAALKKSIHAFTERIEPNHPPCILYIQDEILQQFIEQLKHQLKRRKVKKSLFKDHNPIFNLLEISEDDETIKKLKDIFLGNSPSVQLTRLMIRRAAQSNSNVLILGESGTGKELIAEQIHKNSIKPDNIYFTINCSAIQDTLLESELFGHVKGAFTGAINDKKGLLEEANEGTLFLDEIGDLSLANQAKILRAIEYGDIKKVGGNKIIKVNVRILAATNRNIPALIAQGKFREDLYFRLNEFTIMSPPLREHPDDIPILAKRLWQKQNPEVSLTNEFLSYLQKYPWPGNVRELKGLLNNLSDLFGEISPTPAHVEALRNYRQENLERAMSSDSDFEKMITVQSKMRLIEIENILRTLKMNILHFIEHSDIESKSQDIKITFEVTLKETISKLNVYCREPLFFVKKELYKGVERLIRKLERLQKLPANKNAIQNWYSENRNFLDQIESDIFGIVWGKGKVNF